MIHHIKQQLFSFPMELESNILERMFGVYLCESDIINEISNDMIIGM